METMVEQNSRTSEELNRAKFELGKILNTKKNNCSIQTSVFSQNVSVNTDESSDEVEKKIGQMNEIIDEFEKKIQCLETEKAQLVRKNEELQKEISSIKETMKKLTSKNSMLESRIDCLNSEAHKLSFKQQKNDQRHLDEVESYKNEISNLKKNL